MKILISYGHDYSNLIKRITKDLIARGYDVWLDRDSIVAGEDWRNKIEQGIRECSLVLAFFSPHSIRADSVCHDELKIALSCGCPIRTVLLDDSIIDKLPKFVSGVQYLDFSALENNPSDALSSQYDECLDKLLEMIDRGAFSQHKEIIEQLSIKLHPDKGMLSQLGSLKLNFCKRPWIDEYINSWTGNSSTKMAGIVGFPGSGKSCYCANSFYNPENISALIFCRWFSGDLAINKILKNAAYQIASKLFSYAKRLLWILENGSIDLAYIDNVELFDVLFTEPLNLEIDGQHCPIVMVFDGIDVLTEDNTNELMEIISSRIQRLPSFVHFIITTRNSPIITRYLVGKKSFELLPQDEQVTIDIYNYLKGTLSECVQEDCENIFRTLAKKCHGSFLYASLIVEAIVSGAMSAEETDKYPEEIYDFYFKWMKAIVSDENVFSEEYYKVFSILASVSFPVSLRILLKALEWKKIDWMKFVRKFKSFITESKSFDDEIVLELFHSSFREWMSNEDGVADCYFVDAEEGLDLYSEAIYREYKNGGLKKSEITELIRILLLANKTEYLLDVAEDRELLQGLVDFAEKCQSDVDSYQTAINIFDSIKGLSIIDGENTFADMLMSAKVPYLLAVGEFSYGNLKKVEAILLPVLDNIKELCTAEEYFETLFMLGTSYDWLGNRSESIKWFKKLYTESVKEKNNKYIVRALYGLIWNDHFNNSNEGAEYLQELCAINDLQPEDVYTISLIKARVLLSIGKLEDSKNLYLELLENPVGNIWGYDRDAVKNQMLILEAIVACYDNGLYSKAIEVGEKIYSKLRYRGNLPECYCASWLAFSYLKIGEQEKALQYLSIAEKLNCKSKKAIKSEWMSMHLMSLRNYYDVESSNFCDAYEHYKDLVEAAKECDDSWVMGDACFSLFRLRFLNGVDMTKDEENMYKKYLYYLSEASQLPHLKYKAKLLKTLLGEEMPEEDFLLSLTYTSYPSVDVFSELILCMRIAKANSMQKAVRNIAKSLKEKVDVYNAKNRDTAFNSRNIIKMVLNEVKYEL